MTNKEILEIINILSDSQFEIQDMIDRGVSDSIRESARETLADIRKKRTELYKLLEE